MSELNIATVNQTLQGVWHLDRWEITYDNGRATTYPFGANATGLIHYTQDGGMSACIARADRPRLSSDSVRSAPPARARDALRQRTCSASFSRLMNSASSEKLSSSSVWLRLLFFASMSFSLDMSVLVRTV